MPQQQTKNLREKLFEITNSLPSFVNSEDSAKKDGRDKSAYTYTPGYKIVEAVKTQLCNQRILLETSVTKVESTPVEYTIYKLIGGQAKAFDKKEILATVTAEFVFRDIDTGEVVGPLVHVCQASNGIDKSCVTAISTARRYFFIDFFNIITKDACDDIDANDSSLLPGIPAYEQPRNASDYQAAMASPHYVQYPQFAPQEQYPQQNPYMAQGYGQQPSVQVVQYAGQPQGGAPVGHGQIPDEKNPNIAEAISELVKALEKNPNTQSREYNTALAAQINTLLARGINVYGNGFLANLNEAALAQFQGRRPNFK